MDNNDYPIHMGTLLQALANQLSTSEAIGLLSSYAEIAEEQLTSIQSWRRKAEAERDALKADLENLNTLHENERKQSAIMFDLIGAMANAAIVRLHDNPSESFWHAYLTTPIGQQVDQHIRNDDTSNACALVHRAIFRSEGDYTCNQISHSMMMDALNARRARIEAKRMLPREVFNWLEETNATTKIYEGFLFIYVGRDYIGDPDIPELDPVDDGFWHFVDSPHFFGCQEGIGWYCKATRHDTILETGHIPF